MDKLMDNPLRDLRRMLQDLGASEEDIQTVANVFDRMCTVQSEKISIALHGTEARLRREIQNTLTADS